MVRIVCEVVSNNPAGEHDGASYRTFDINADELEAFLRQYRGGYSIASVVGAELREPNL